MATLKSGVNGGFSGTVGSVIGSNWKGIDYIKGKISLKRSRKRLTDKQQVIRNKFKTTGEFLTFFKDVLCIGLGKQNLKKMTAYNLAVRLNKNAIEQTGDSIRIDFPRIILSKGTAVSRPAICTVRWQDVSELDIHWGMFGHSLTERPTDRVVLAVYCEERRELISDIGSRSRADSWIKVEISSSWADSSVHVYLFMVSAEGLCSETVYVGPLKYS